MDHRSREQRLRQRQRGPPHLTRATVLPDRRGGRFPRWDVRVTVAVVVAGVVAGVVLFVLSDDHPRPTSKGDSLGPVSAELVEDGDLGDLADAQVLHDKLEPTFGARAAGARPTVPADRLPDRRPAPCEATARALQPGDEVLVYVAGARWQGTPAEVLGFSPTGARATSSGRPIPTRVYVLARSGCQVLAFQSFAP